MSIFGMRKEKKKERCLQIFLSLLYNCSFTIFLMIEKENEKEKRKKYACNVMLLIYKYIVFIYIGWKKTSLVNDTRTQINEK